MNGAARFSFSQVEATKALKVFGWTMASGLVALLLSLVEVLDIPVEYAFIVPIVNTILYAVKEFIADNR
jgi:hypothetical protein